MDTFGRLTGSCGIEIRRGESRDREDETVCRWFEWFRICITRFVGSAKSQSLEGFAIPTERQGTIVVNWPKRGDMEITGTQAWNGSRARRDNATQVSIDIAETLRKGLAALVARWYLLGLGLGLSVRSFLYHHALSHVRQLVTAKSASGANFANRGQSYWMSLDHHDIHLSDPSARD